MRIQSFIFIGMVMAALSFAEDTITFTGTVTGPQDKAVDAASLKLYGVSFQTDNQRRIQLTLIGQTQSDSNGNFSFAVKDLEKDKPSYYTCIASKEGLSYGFKSLYNQDQKLDIVLTQPQKVIGFVYGPDGNPVKDAEVRLVLLCLKGDEQSFTYGMEPVTEFAATTCDQGRFEFDKLPEGSSFDFLVKKEPLAPLLTFKNRNPEKGLTYNAGQTDIMLTMQNPCTISGTVVAKENQTPIEGISVAAVHSSIRMTSFNIEPAKSAADGKFEITGLPPAKYQLRMIDNDQWVADTVSVDVNGKVEAKLELEKGGLLEVKVLDSQSAEPIESAQVHIGKQGSSGSLQSCQTDASGLAKKRLIAGTYDIRIYKEAYSTSTNSAVAIIEDGKTASVEVRLDGPQKLTGIVKTPDGKPAQGVKVQVLPNNGPQTTVLTDDNGRFSLDWNPQNTSWTEGEFLFVAIDAKNNLAKTEPIGPDAKDLTVTLQKACTICGKVLDESGKPLADASARLSISGSRWSTSFGESVKSDANGQYTFASLPIEQKFYVSLSGKGYGSGSKQFTTESEGSQTAIEDIVLKLANLTLAGQAVDKDGNALADIQVQMYGQGQPNDNVVTDKNGRFKFENVCPGSVQLHAYTQSAEKHMYSNFRTEGGAQDISIVLSEQGNYNQYEPKKPASLVGKDLPELSHYGVDVSADANSILVFIWDMNQRPSRHFIKELAKQKDLLDSKKTAVILLNASSIEKERLNKWLTENDITYPCGIIAIDPENAKFNLGVQSIPWLILTDKNKKVAAEGFSVDELNDKLNAI